MADASLKELLSFGWDVQKRIESGELTRKDKEFDSLLRKALEDLSLAQERVEALGMFSRNEELDEVATADLKFMMVPALLGSLTFQLMEGERLVNLKKAKEYFTEYLQRCYDYAITAEQPPVTAGRSGLGTPSDFVQRKSIEQLSAERDKKMARYRSRKEMEKKLKHLSSLIDSASSSTHSIDDEVLRDHVITSLKLWVFEGTECIDTINQEIQLVSMRPPPGTYPPPPAAEATPRPHPPPKPVVITREMLKDKVFGAGYPSLPSMTVEEFYDKTYKDQQHNQTVSKPSSKEEEEEKETNEDEEEEQLKKEREFDDYKDDHRRGWGNRKNMG